MRRIIALFTIVFLAALVQAETNDVFQQAWDNAWQGEHAAAIQSYQQFADENADHTLAPVAMFNAASLTMVELEDLETAKQSFGELVEKYPETKWAAEGYCRLAEIAVAQEKPKDGVNYYLEGLKRAEGDDYRMPEIWFTNALEGCQQSLDGLENPEYEIDVYKKLMDYIPPGNAAAETMYNLGNALKESDQQEEAAATFSDLLFAYPTTRVAGAVLQTEHELIDAHKELPWEDIEKARGVDALARQQNYEQALVDLRDIAARYAGTTLGENAEYAIISIGTRVDADFESGLEKLEAYLDKYPDGVVSTRAGQVVEFYEEVLSSLDRLKFDPEDYVTHTQVGFTLLRNGYMNKAEQHFLAAKADTTSDVAYMGLGYVYLNSGRPEEGIENMQIYLENHPDNGGLYNQIGYAFIGLGQLDEALKCFERYRELEPDNPNSHDSYAECLMHLEKYEESIAEYKVAIDIDPNFTNPYFMLGEIFRQMENTENALKYYQEYISRDPAGFLGEQARTHVEELSQQ
jgi:tetratricopeptide (TPR) repeat protein